MKDEDYAVDQIDYRILKILQENARETASSISKQIHLSVSAVIERIHKLEETNVINKYTIIVDEKRMGNQTTALVEVNISNPKYHAEFAKAMMEMDTVVSCYYQTGDASMLVKVACASTEELEEVISLLMSLPGVTETHTHVILRTIKNVYSAIRKPKEGI